VARDAIRAALGACVAALAAAGPLGCAAGLRDVPVGSVRLQIVETSVRLHQHDLTIRLSAGRGLRAPLVLYGTGDGGWRGGDAELFERLVAWGFPSAGFNAREYVSHLEGGAPTETPDVLAADMTALVETAARELMVAGDTPFVFVGKSRGAGLAVAAATAPSLHARLKGVLAIGLTREEEYVSAVPAHQPAGSPPVMFETYAALAQLAEIPVAVIQSTRDGYITAADARELVGPDTATRRLRPIESDGHNFGGAVDAMYAEMRRSFDWILAR
jgi:hypothetical protein